MESYPFQHLSRKQIRKLAAQFSDEEVRQSLGEDGENRAFIFAPAEGPEMTMFWNAYNGPMVNMDDDSVRAYAHLDFMHRHGYPRFESLEEVEAYARAHDWPRKNRE